MPHDIEPRRAREASREPTAGGTPADDGDTLCARALLFHLNLPEGAGTAEGIIVSGWARRQGETSPMWEDGYPI